MLQIMQCIKVTRRRLVEITKLTIVTRGIRPYAPCHARHTCEHIIGYGYARVDLIVELDLIVDLVDVHGNRSRSTLGIQIPARYNGNT